MINVSDEFRTLMETDTSFMLNAEITTVDGQKITLDKSDFTIDNNAVTDAAGAGALPLGSAIARTIRIEIMNDSGFLEDLALMGAKIRLFLTFQLSETVEKIEYGTFTVVEPETYGETVIISAIDDMYKADKEYKSVLTFPQTAASVFRDACTQCGLLIGSSDFPNNSFIVRDAPEGLTCREVIGYVAQIAGGNARVDRFGAVRIITYDLSDIEVSENLSTNGGTFSPWTSGDVLSGGTFSPWTHNEILSGGTFVPWTTDSGGSSGGALIPDGVHALKRWINLKIDTDDIVITGIQTVKEVEDAEGNITEQTIMYGDDGYIIAIDNPLIAGNPEAAIQGIGDILIGGRIRKFSGDHVAYPLAEFGDKAVIFDRKGNWYQTVLTDVDFEFFGMTTLENSAEPAIRNSSKYNNSKAQAIIAAKELVEREKTQRELAVEKLNQALANSSGLYETEEVQPDGSTIYYFHDKPTIEESQNVIKFTAEAIGISNNGGETYPFGFTLNGEMVMSIIAAEGLNADWITSGALVVRNGNEVVFQADVDTGIVTINSKNFQLDKDGNMTATNGKFTGEINAEIGTIGDFVIETGKLTSEGGHGIELNTARGSVKTGAIYMSGAGENLGSIGITHNTSGSQITFNETGSGDYGLSLYAKSGKKIRMRSDTDFSGDVTFYGNVTFENPPFSALDAWPVGSIFITTSNTNPRNLLGGGLWEQLSDVFLVAARKSSTGTFAPGSTGGSTTHTLAFDEMPNHTHNIATYAGGVSASGGAVQRGTGGSTSQEALKTGSAGGDAGVTQPFSILPPYLAVYMWKRVE